MNKHIYYPGQEILDSELNSSIDDHILNLKNRFGNIITPGIFKASELYAALEDEIWNIYGEFTVTPSSERDSGVGAYFIDVSSGIAFSNTNEYIHIASDSEEIYDATNPDLEDSLGNPTPKSTGHWVVPVTSGIINYVYIQYLETVDTSTVSGDPENNYTVDPDTGVVSYVARTDGYVVGVVASLGAIPTGALYLGSVDATTIDLVIDLDDKVFSSINGAMVRVLLPTFETATESDVYESSIISVDQHIRSIANIDNLTNKNPHGLGIEDIPGLVTAIGPYSLYPEIYNDNGIIDKLEQVPGPFFPTATFTASTNVPTISLISLSVSQYINIDSVNYTNEAAMLSEVYDETTVLKILNIPAVFRCDFSNVIPERNHTGYFYICLTAATSDDGESTGLKATAIYSGVSTASEANLLDLIMYPENYVLDGAVPIISTHFPVGIVFYDPVAAEFVPMIDPQTGEEDLLVLDIRTFGTISTKNLLFEKRYYGTGPGESYSTDLVILKHNIQIRDKDLTVATGNIGVSSGNINVAEGKIQENGFSLLPPGVVLPYAANSSPDGFFLCDGSVVSRSTYAALFAAIGETYGSGDGSTTFHLPDLQGQFIRGFDTAGAVDPARVFGSNQDDLIKNHTHNLHTYQARVTYVADHSHERDGVNINAYWNSATGDPVTGGGTETRPKNVAMHYIIKY